MKIAVTTDAHANLPALDAALKAIQAEACDAIFHLGDAIAIGPYPAECLDLMQETSNLTCVSGNHDLYSVNGLPDPQPDWMSDGEVQHQLWTHEQLGSQRKLFISCWPLVHEDVFERVKTVFVHYGMTDSGNDFMKVVRNPDSADLDKMFAELKAELLFLGARSCTIRCGRKNKIHQSRVVGLLPTGSSTVYNRRVCRWTGGNSASQYSV